MAVHLAELQQLHFSEGVTRAEERATGRVDDGLAASLERENQALRARNESDAQKLRKLEVLTANIGRDISRLCLPFDQEQGRDRRNAALRRQQLEARHAKLTQQNRDLRAAAAAREQALTASADASGEAERHRGWPGSPRRPGEAVATLSDDEMLRHPATVRMLDALLEREDTVTALRNDVAKLQASARELEPQQLASTTRALRSEIELVEAQAALKRTEAEQVQHRMDSLRASCAQLVERAGALRREKLEVQHADNGLLEKVFALLQAERTELEAEIADTFQHNQHMSLLAAEQSRLRSSERDQASRLTRRFQLLRSHTEGLRSLLGAYMQKRAGLRDVVFNQDERNKAITADMEALREQTQSLSASNAAAATLLGLLDMRQRDSDADADLGPIPPELTTKDGRDVSQLLGSVRTVEAAIVEAGGERAWEHMAEVLWRVRQQIGEKLTPPAQVLRTEIALTEVEIASTRELLEQQESLGDRLVDARAAATVEVGELYGRSLTLASGMAELEALDRRCQQLGEMRRALAADPTSWKRVRATLRQEAERITRFNG
jgi:hypothetical protein